MRHHVWVQLRGVAHGFLQKLVAGLVAAGAGRAAGADQLPLCPLVFGEDGFEFLFLCFALGLHGIAHGFAVAAAVFTGGLEGFAVFFGVFFVDFTHFLGLCARQIEGVDHHLGLFFRAFCRIHPAATGASAARASLGLELHGKEQEEKRGKETQEMIHI